MFGFSAFQASQALLERVFVCLKPLLKTRTSYSRRHALGAARGELWQEWWLALPAGSHRRVFDLFEVEGQLARWLSSHTAVLAVALSVLRFVAPVALACLTLRGECRPRRGRFPPAPRCRHRLVGSCRRTWRSGRSTEERPRPGSFVRLPAAQISASPQPSAGKVAGTSQSASQRLSLDGCARDRSPPLVPSSRQLSRGPSTRVAVDV